MGMGREEEGGIVEGVAFLLDDISRPTMWQEEAVDLIVEENKWAPSLPLLLLVLHNFIFFVTRREE